MTSGFPPFPRSFTLRLTAVVALVAAGVAGTAFGQAIQMTPEFQRSRELLAQNDFEGAMNALQPLLQQPALAAAAQIEMGGIRQRQAENEMSKALSHFSEAAQYLSQGAQAGGLSEAEQPKVLYDLARIYEERLNDYPKAVEAYLQVVQGFPNFLSIDKATYRLASCYEKMNRQEEAAAWYRDLVAKYPYSSYFQAAQNRMKALSPGTAGAKAAIEIQEGLVDSARSDLQGARAQLDLAAMYARNGNTRQAIEEYRKVIAEAPSNELVAEAYRKMITLLDEKEKDYKAAAEAIEEMLARFPDAPGNDQNLLRLGKIYEKDLETYRTRVIDGQVRYRKDVDNTLKAIEYYDRLTERYPDADVSADAYVRKGDLYLETLKDPDEARKQYQEFLQRFPDHPQSESVREKLKAIEREY
ncbi:MAG: Adventurous gliding motility protein K [Candidatus Ozemobacter sibiricus]|jgi:tetratricopeptide (TPR) repeat protein|uniref:Adventurous gliding motility protein K n=1 Tax=Candidatus Ozemobacter sibiricus TaxID=2268124 RepID=A0A367ZN13_9BACT|nr:MAG: Adventurous gliding motility protein K [Candidatus Ozemobacter sibiricus]